MPPAAASARRLDTGTGALPDVAPPTAIPASAAPAIHLLMAFPSPCGTSPVIGSEGVGVAPTTAPPHPSRGPGTGAANRGGGHGFLLVLGDPRATGSSAALTPGTLGSRVSPGRPATPADHHKRRLQGGDEPLANRRHDGASHPPPQAGGGGLSRFLQTPRARRPSGGEAVSDRHDHRASTPLHLVVRRPVDVGRDRNGLLLADAELFANTCGRAPRPAAWW